MTTNNQNSEETLQQGGPQTNEQGQREQSGAYPSQTATVDAANQELTNINGTSDELPPPPPPHVPNTQGDDHEPIYESLGFWDIVKRCMVWNIRSFSGRATRKEYWFFALFIVSLFILVSVFSVAVIICNYDVGSEEYFKAMKFFDKIIQYLSIALTLPNLSVTSRRLHDIGLNGWWCLINLIPCVNILFLVVMCMPSKKERNKYGPYVIN